MSRDEEIGSRIRQLLQDLGKTQKALADRLGVKPQQLNQVVTGERPGEALIDEIAKALDVNPIWIRTGAPHLAPEWMTIVVESRPEDAGRSLSLVGQVKAGDGNVDDYIEEDAVDFPLKRYWQVIQVNGNSAYPVCYPKQFVMIDNDRAVDPNDKNLWTKERREDLHDNIVFVKTKHKEGEKRYRAFLKRFCCDERAPGGYVMASIDGGRSSPWIPVEDIEFIIPVVGVVFEDPRKSRVKGRSKPETMEKR